MEFIRFGLISGSDLGRIWVGFGYVSLCKTSWKPSGTQKPPRNPQEPTLQPPGIPGIPFALFSTADLVESENCGRGPPMVNTKPSGGPPAPLTRVESIQFLKPDPNLPDWLISDQKTNCFIVFLASLKLPKSLGSRDSFLVPGTAWCIE